MKYIYYIISHRAEPNQTKTNKKQYNTLDRDATNTIWKRENMKNWFVWKQWSEKYHIEWNINLINNRLLINMKLKFLTQKILCDELWTSGFEILVKTLWSSHILSNPPNDTT